MTLALSHSMKAVIYDVSGYDVSSALLPHHPARHRIASGVLSTRRAGAA